MRHRGRAVSPGVAGDPMSREASRSITVPAHLR
jgi:hypothetical protein